MPRSPQSLTGSRKYEDGWRAINLLIRSGGSWSGRERKTCYRNLGNGKFADISYISGLDFAGDGRSFVALDIDHDGDLDLVLKFRTAPQIRVMRNNLGNGNRGLILELAGTKSNRDAVGTRVTLETDRGRRTRWVRSGSGFLSQSSRRLHFGIEKGERPKALLVRWPSGMEQRIDDVPAAGLFRLMEGKAGVSQVQPVPSKLSPPPSRGSGATAGTWLVEPLPAPGFSLGAIDGKARRLFDYQGKKVLLNFWATWCPPCRTELDGLRAASQNLKNAGVEVLAVSVDQPGERRKVEEFAAGFPFPMLLADDHTVGAYSILNRHLFDRRRDLGIPTSFLIDESGKIIKVYQGAAPAAAVLADAGARQRPALAFSGKRYTPAPRRNYVEMATAMAERGFRAEARSLFESAIAAGQSGSELYNNYAGLLIAGGDLEQGEKLLRASLARNANQAESHANLGALLLRQGRADAARPEIEEAIRLQPDDASLYSALGSACFAMEKLADAERYYREAVRLAPASGEFHYNLGAVLVKLERLDEALAAFEQARRLGSDSVELMNQLGVLYMETGRPADAQKEFLRAVETDPAHVGSWINLALYDMKTGNLGAALDCLQKAKALDPRNPAPYLLGAQVFVEQGKSSAARALLQELLAIEPGEAQALQLLRSIP